MTIIDSSFVLRILLELYRIEKLERFRLIDNLIE